MHQPPPADQSTFESQAQYNLQATEDVEEEHNEPEAKKHPPAIPKRPNYRPKPLQWPFIICMVLVLSVLMGLVVYARETMPNSDSTATIEPRNVLWARQEPSSAAQQPSVTKPIPSPTPEPTPSAAPASTPPPQAPSSSDPPAAPNTPTPTPTIVPSSKADPPATSEEKQPTAQTPISVPSPTQANTPQAPSSSGLGTPTPPIVPSSSAEPRTMSEQQRPPTPTATPILTTATERSTVNADSNTVLEVSSSLRSSSNRAEEKLSAASTSSAASENREKLNSATSSTGTAQSEPSNTALAVSVSEGTKESSGIVNSDTETSLKSTQTASSSTTSRDAASFQNTKTSSFSSQTSTASKSDDQGNVKGLPTSATSLSGSNTDLTSSTDLAGQRKVPPTGVTSLSVSVSSSPSPSPSSRSVSTIQKPIRSDEIISVITSEFTSTLTRPGSEFTYSTHYTTYVSSFFTSVRTTTFPGSTGESTFTTVITTAVTQTTTRTHSGSSFLTTMTLPMTTTGTTVIDEGETTYSRTTTMTGTRVTTSTVAGTVGTTVETTTKIIETSVVSTSRFTSPPSTSVVTSIGATAVPTTIASVGTTTGPGVVYVSVGTTEITRVITIPGGSRGQQNNDPTPVTQVITSVFDQQVVTVVETAPPQRIVTNNGGVFTAVFTPPPETIVSRNGGQETQLVVMVTPSPDAAFVAVPTVISGKSTFVMVESTFGVAGIFKQVATTINGKETVVNIPASPTPVLVAVQTTINGKPTVVTVESTFGAGGVFKEVATTINGKATVVNVAITPEPVLVAVQTTIDGTPTVLLVQSTPSAGFKPVSLTLVSQIGGSTGIFTTTDPPETIKTVIDGKETTIVRTPSPREYTSVVGGTPTTIEIVTTPTGTMPLSFTIVTTIGGSLTTIVSTPKRITLVTSISGKLSTITTTPKPTTRLSTIKASTTTITSVTQPTSTDADNTVITQVERFAFTNGDYFIGKFLPVILAVMITIPLRIIDLNAKLYQPFYALAQDGGALGKNSITLQFDGWKGLLAPFEVLLQGHPVPFITTLILWSSAMLVPLATEAIGMKLHGRCKVSAIEGCGIQLGVSNMSAHALVALLAFIIVLLLVLLYFLRNWETGLHANPWSIAGISSLARNADIRSQQIDFKASRKAMAEKNYMLGYFENSRGRDEYGIIYYDDTSQNLQAAASGALPADDELDGSHQRRAAKKSRKPVPFIALTYWWRLGFIFFIASLFVLVLYYHITLRVRTSFKDVTDSQTWGVRFFLSALGVIIIFCWESVFVSIAIISPYYHMGRRSQQPESSILLTRPTNSFYGIYAAILEGNVVLMLAAFMAILAEFLPILLTNIPYNLTQTLTTHNVCALISIAILALMMVTLTASLFIKWPEMPVDPRSIAGAMYYVNESRMLEDFEGLAQLNSKDREQKVKELGRRYFYGAVTGRHGRRMGVESVESVEDTAYTGGHWFLPRREVEEHHDEQASEHGLEHGLEHQDQGHESEHHSAQNIQNREVALI